MNYKPIQVLAITAFLLSFGIPQFASAEQSNNDEATLDTHAQVFEMATVTGIKERKLNRFHEKFQAEIVANMTTLEFDEFLLDKYRTRRKVGLGLLVSGITIAVAGTVMFGVVMGLSANDEGCDPDISAHGCFLDGIEYVIGGIASIGTTLLVGIPLILVGSALTRRTTRITKKLEAHLAGSKTSQSRLRFFGVSPMLGAHGQVQGASVSFSFSTNL